MSNRLVSANIDEKYLLNVSILAAKKKTEKKEIIKEALDMLFEKYEKELK